MSTLFRQFLILIKRTFYKPVYGIVLTLIPLTAIFVKSLPKQEVSTDIRSGICVEDQNIHTKALLELLCADDTGFLFIVFDSPDAVRDAVASGEIDCGYYLPAGFSETYPNDRENTRIQVYISPSTMFSDVTMEILFDNLLKVFAVPIVSHYFSADPELSDYLMPEYDEAITSIYREYMTDNSVFHIVTNGTGTGKHEEKKLSLFPLYPFIGLLIFTSALLGLLNTLKDEDNHVYSGLTKKSRFRFCIMNIISSLIPTACIGYITLLIYGTEYTPSALALHMLVYIIICLFFTLAYRLLFSSYRRYLAALPVLLTCTILLSPVFIDLTQFLPVLKLISYFFAPTYF